MFIDLFVKKKCGYCQEEVTGIHIQCIICNDDLCLQVSDMLLNLLAVCGGNTTF